MIAAAEHILDKPTLALVNEFRKAEDLWLMSFDVSISAKSLAAQFEMAIRSRNFVVEMPYLSTIETGYDPEFGQVYCARSASKEGQLKIGVTTMKLKARLQKMTTKHGLSEVRPLFSISVSNPAVIESQAKKKLRESRVAGRTQEDSNEWYRTSAIEFVRAVAATIGECGHLVTEITLYADCPNASNVNALLNQLGVHVIRGVWL
jgi:hypothetical protein